MNYDYLKKNWILRETEKKKKKIVCGVGNLVLVWWLLGFRIVDLPRLSVSGHSGLTGDLIGSHL